MNKLIRYLLFISLLLYVSCAQQGAPTGGPEDIDPPRVIKAEPENYSVMFDGKKILITFDEFLDMGNFTQELVVSPPMEEKPLVKLRNKTLIIEFEEELKDDVTYTFNFGEGIKDLNEKNVLMNFEYVFSTGEKLDSLSIKGTLKNAEDLSIPESPIYVMLYNELADTMPLTTIPYYVGRTDKEGNFQVNNLRADVYKLFVLKDGNNNFLFDMPNEQIAFLDTSLMVSADYFQKILLESGKYDSSDLMPDTSALAVDTSGMSLDSIIMVLDSLERLKPDFTSLYVDLFMFTEDPDNQYISEYEREERKIMDVVFNLPVTDSFSYRPIVPSNLSLDDFVPYFGLRRDSLRIFPGDTLTASYDTIVFAVSYTMQDSMGVDYMKEDTLHFSFRDKPKKKEKKNNEEAEEEKVERLSIKTIRNGGKQNLHQDLVMTITYPLKSFNDSLIQMFEIPDSVNIPMQVVPFQDTNHLSRIRIENSWKEEMKYRIVMYPGAVTDIYETINDTIDLTFTAKALSDYGKLILDLKEVNDPILIQVIKKDVVTRTMSVEASGVYEFEYMDPDTYTIKFIHDINRNGKWDTGKYIEGLQPEKVEFLQKEIKVRANWDHDVEYIIGSNNSPPKKAESEKKQEKGLFQ